ncbi:MAG: hypothetical protein P8181_14415, partial [bacterium]
MSSRLLTTCGAVLLLVVLGESSPAAAGSEKISPKTLTRKARAEMSRGAEVFYGGTMIPAATTRKGPVIVINGSLDIQEEAVLGGAGRPAQALRALRVDTSSREDPPGGLSLSITAR